MSWLFLLLSLTERCTVSVGLEVVKARVVWLHSYPTSNPYEVVDFAVGPGNARIIADGAPVGIEWSIDSTIIKRCGWFPDGPGGIFGDTFDDGTLDSWSEVRQ